MSELRMRIEAAIANVKELVHTREPGVEGSASLDELCHLAQLARELPSACPVIGEIGFNFGFSSMAFMIGNPAAKVVSFDIGMHDYVLPSKSIVDALFPDRHQLVVGDSRETVPQYARENAGSRFDLAFIDGGHEFEIALKDIENMRALADQKTVLVVDDLVWYLRWGIGPWRAWRNAKRRGIVRELGRRKDGFWKQRRVWARGCYVEPAFA